ncbi:copper resistance protein CopC [Pseudonocardia xinjiangensis]|uniref:copper resistance protein CopC n=1 Tax=Pseudonocardia xinjiangensis TaxID=75289 RepID=UPI003D8B35FC
MTPACTPPPALARGVLGLLIVVAACWGTLLAAMPMPGGDPVLVSVSPGAGELVKSPDEVRLTFDRPVPAGLATVRMTSPSGEQVVAGRPRNPAGAADTLAVAMPPTRYAGTYSVAWSLPSSRLEPISGTSSFAVFAPTTPVRVPEIATERDPVVTVVHTAFRLAATAALTLGVGVTFVLVAAWPAGVRYAPAGRLIKYAWWTLVLTTLGTIVSFGAYAARTSLGEAFDPALLSGTLGSDIGAGLLARLLVLVPVALGLVQLLTGPSDVTAAQRRFRAAAVLGGAAALIATWGFSRPHDPEGPAPLVLGAEIALLLAVAVSVGGPVVLWLLLRGAGDSVLRVAVPRLARLMPVCGLLLLTVAAGTAGGWQLVALLVLVALVVGTGLAGRRWMRRRADVRGLDLPGRVRLRRLAAVATGAVAVALVAAAVSDTGRSQLALGGSTGGDQQIRTHVPGVR